jgi:Lon protease-like protein
MDEPESGADEPAAQLPQLPLFPLQTVLFPGGRLPLKVFEARYVDLVGRCLRSGEPFGVVALRQGAEVGARAPGQEMEAVGTLASIEEVDAEQPGILLVRCSAGRRFRLTGAPAQRRDGLWTAAARLLPEDPVVAPPAELAATVQALARLAESLGTRGMEPPWTGPLRHDDAGWVANRWCELLPIALGTRQKLMELEDPAARLGLVDGFLRSRGIVKS